LKGVGVRYAQNCVRAVVTQQEIGKVGYGPKFLVLL
jgi:hypothetical protein